MNRIASLADKMAANIFAEAKVLSSLINKFAQERKINVVSSSNKAPFKYSYILEGGDHDLMELYNTLDKDFLGRYRRPFKVYSMITDENEEFTEIEITLD